MSEGKIRVAVIGAGEHGRNHAQHYMSLPNAKLAGVYDLRPERREGLAAQLGVRSLTSLEAVWQAADAVSVVIPATDHAAVAREAFAHGIDVLLEKPISRTVEEADELIHLAAGSGRILQVGHVERFNPGAAAAKAITRRPLFFEVHRLGVFSPRSLDVDVVFDLMIHDLDLILWLVDSPATEVRAVGLPVLSDKVDIANARVEFANGAVANLTASRVSTEKVRKFRYFQASEYISIDFSRRDVLVVGINRAEGNPQLTFRRLETQRTDPLRAEIEAFLDSVRTRRPPQAGGREGREALALATWVMDCIREHGGKVNLRLTQPPGQSGES
ncbi:MAG: Gfo/Idh/MocA family protein [Terriglobia bacterium]